MTSKSQKDYNFAYLDEQAKPVFRKSFEKTAAVETMERVIEAGLTDQMLEDPEHGYLQPQWSRLLTARSI